MDILKESIGGNMVQEHLLALGIIAASFVLAAIVKRVANSWLRKWAQNTQTKIDDIIIELLYWPLYWVVVVIGTYIGLNALALPEWLGKLVHGFTVLAASLVVALALSRLVNLLFEHFVSRLAERTDSRLDDQIVPVLRRTIMGIIWIVAILLILDNFGYDVTALITGLGLGGLALAMASKDTLSNVLGGLTIFLDQPFRIGDVVEVKDTTGTVEEVGLRTTRIRTFEGHLVTIPNALAASSVISNISARPKLRVRFVLGLAADTPTGKCHESIGAISEAIKAVDGVTEDEPSVVFTEFAESSLNFQITYYLANDAAILDAKHAVNLNIKDNLEAIGVEMPFPTITLDAPDLTVKAAA